MKLNVIALALATGAFAFSAQAQTVIVKECTAAPAVTVTTTTGAAVRHCTNRKVTHVNSNGVRVTKTVQLLPLRLSFDELKCKRAARRARPFLYAIRQATR